MKKLILAFCCYSVLIACSSLPKQPNIIYIMIDDLGYGDFSCYGQASYQTPHVDAFTKEGLKFTAAYAAAPVCTPTRVAFMTGKYPARTPLGLYEPLTMSKQDFTKGLSPSLPTVSSILKRQGYETALFGKWHLGFTEEYFPTKHGFDHFFGIISGAADYIDHKPVNRYGGILVKDSLHVLYQNEEPVTRKGYLSDLITDAAIDFLQQKHNKPFFMSLQYTSPHWPWQHPGSEPVADTLDFATSGSTQNFIAMITNLDSNIGRLLSSIQENGFDKTTLIILTSDNGGERYSNMKPFKGHKMQLWEGGIRVPAIVRWPGVTTPSTQSDQPVITMDWTATILEAAGYRLENSQLDGINLRPHFSNPSSSTERSFFWRTSNRVQAKALRKGNWKYLQTAEGEFLFNLAEDPSEQHDVSGRHQEEFKRLKSEYERFSQQMLPPLILTR